MNRAEYITKTIHDANEAGVIDQSNSVRVLLEVASLLNSGMHVDDIDTAPEMEALWKEVRNRWG